MSTMEPLYSQMRIITYTLSKEELLILEAELFSSIYKELREHCRNIHANYFRLMKFNTEQENSMLDINFIRIIMNDIISSDEYNLEGIARYTNIHEDVLNEIFTGNNINPSAELLQRIIELHQSIRRDLYNSIMKKIARQYLTAA